MKTLKFYAAIGTLVLAMAFTGCSKDEVDSPMVTASNGTSKVLSVDEQEGLLSLLELQKMQVDVYSVIADHIQQPVFTDLKQQDTKLMELLSVKVDKYGLENPIVGKAAGEFEDESVQDKYNEFIRTTGFEWNEMVDYATSMEKAFIDVVQIQKLRISGNDDIVQLYEEIQKQSESHLNALYNEWENFSHIYAPKDEHREN